VGSFQRLDVLASHSRPDLEKALQALQTANASAQHTLGAKLNACDVPSPAGELNRAHQAVAGVEIVPRSEFAIDGSALSTLATGRAPRMASASSG
jgi:hypothetical protein